MFQSYGQAEAPFFLTYLSAQDHVRAVSSDAHARLLNSCGRATMFAEVEIMDDDGHILPPRSEEHTSELKSLMRISYAVFCLKKNNTMKKRPTHEDLKVLHTNTE